MVSAVPARSSRRSPKPSLAQPSRKDEFQQFWDLRGGPAAFEAWRQGALVPTILVRVVGPGFVAGFEVGETVVRAAPILRRWLMGKTEAEARAVIRERNWSATIVK